MIRKLRRSAGTGRIVTPDEARRHPDTTVTETIDPPFTTEHVNLLGYLVACTNKHGIRETIHRLQD